MVLDLASWILKDMTFLADCVVTVGADVYRGVSFLNIVIRNDLGSGTHEPVCMIMPQVL